MGGYEDNDAISDQIWSSLVQTNTENIADQAALEQEPIPQVNVDWLNPEEVQQRQNIQIGEEVNRRMRVKKNQLD